MTAGTPAEEVARLLRADLRAEKAYGAPQLDVPVQLNVNENSFPVPAVVVDAMANAVRDVAPRLNRYPDREFAALRGALATYLTREGVEITVDQVWAGNGSNEVLLHLLQAFGGQGRTALGFTPAYSMHPIISRTTGTEWVDGRRGTETGPFDLSAESAAEQVRDARPDVVFLCSPNNPTGTALTAEVVLAVHDAAPNAVIVVDEAYAEFRRDDTPSALPLLAGRPRLVVTRTMSKAFALAGGRLGYLAAAPELVDALRLVRMPYHLSAVTQAVAEAALEHADAMLETVDILREQRDRIVTTLDDLDFAPVASDANFVLFGGVRDAHELWTALLERGVLIRDVGIPHYLRVSAGTPEETTTFLDAMTDLAPHHRQEQS